MNDGIIKNDGTSRLMRATLPATYEEFKRACEAGTQPLDVLFNAAGWAQLPDFLNKGNLWKDTTAALFGLGVDSMPDDGFAYLGKYAQHWWLRRTAEYDKYTATIETSETEAPVYPYYSGESISLYVGDSYTVDKNTGVVSITSPTLLQPTASTTNPSSVDFIVPFVNGNLLQKYFKNGEDGVVYYLPSSINGLSIISDSPNRTKNLRVGVTQYVKVKKQTIPAGAWEYIQSSDRSAYPDFGEQDGYEYEYLGIPFDNAVGAPKIEAGSYVGTGKYGADNPSSLTFGFIPKIVIICRTVIDSGNQYYPFYRWAIFFPWASGGESNGYNYAFSDGGTAPSGRDETFSNLSGNTLSWYCGRTGNTSGQMNESNAQYKYIAFG